MSLNLKLNGKRMRTATDRKIEKLRREIKYAISQIEIWKTRIDTEENRIQDKANKIIELENEKCN
jgi:hypothetical protein